jgi:hypothetical protein
MFDVSLRTKLSVPVLAQRKIESARPRKHGLFLRAEEKMRLYGRTLGGLILKMAVPCFDRNLSQLEVLV